MNLVSTHNPGRTIRVYVEDQRRVSEFLTNAVQAAFDWVSYQSNNFVRLSVIPDSKFRPLGQFTTVELAHLSTVKLYRKCDL